MPNGSVLAQLEHRPARSPPFGSQTVQGPQVRQVTVHCSPSPKAQESKDICSDHISVRSPVPCATRSFNHGQFNFISDMDPPSSKVTCNVAPYLSTDLYQLQSSQDYIQEWLPKKQLFASPSVQWGSTVTYLLSMQQCHQYLEMPWLLPESPDVHQLLGWDNHASNPFHRIDHWTGSFFEPAWLFQLVLYYILAMMVNPVLATSTHRCWRSLHMTWRLMKMILRCYWRWWKQQHHQGAEEIHWSVLP